ncbi:hypothetical protein [uncultured Prevotella sp.]|uniref:hypothetical protein n=1 Tax=uncultured Prevotella sp. TaxID=159272 RepID=UPI0025CCF43F|nr:hypothetical protein [uncultured Prevotella sp.]
MKKYFALAVAATMFTACTNEHTSYTGVVENEKAKVVISFAPDDGETMTRAMVPVGDVVNRLDVWLFEGDAMAAVEQTEAVAESHQTKDDDGFGSLSVTLDKNRTYTLYAVGHKESTSTSISGGVVSFPDTKKLQTLYYIRTFTPSETTTLSCMMKRAVGAFRVVFNDEVPEDVKKLSISTTQTPTQWSFPQLAGVSPSDSYTVEWTKWSKDKDGMLYFTVYVLGSDTETQHDFVVTAYGEDSSVLKSRTFTSVPIRNNYMITYRGSFFLDTAFSSSFTVDDEWKTYDDVEY